MSRNCEEKLNPARLKRDGVHQGQRLLAALDPAYAKVDEHEPSHWMVFAGRYAAFIHFFEKNNAVTGNWEPFFKGNPAAYLATAAVQNVDSYRLNIQQYTRFLLDIANDGDVPGLRKAFGNLFNCTGTLAWQLEQLQKALPDSVPLKAVLKNLILSQLAPGMARLVQYYKAALLPTTNPLLVAVDAIPLQPNDIDLTSPPEWDILGGDVLQFDAVLNQSFSMDWIAVLPADSFSAPVPIGGFPDWASFSAALKADSSVYGNPLPLTTFGRLNHAAAHNLFSSIFEQFLKAYSRTVAEAKHSLQTIFEKQDDHDPHYALFLAFLRLLSHARDYANTLTERHLDFYYKDVLQLKTKSASPNEVHLLVELAKHKDTHLLTKGTVLKAGKDSQGNDVFYQLAEDFVANKAKVADLKSVFHYKKKASDLLNDVESGRIFASPKADSADGLGAELTTTDKQWHPFANKAYKGDLLKKTEMPLADIGCAIASHYLWLREGERTVTLSFNNPINDNLLNESLNGKFIIELTGEKGWLHADMLKATRLGNNLTLRFKLDGDQPAVVPFSTKIHGEGMEAGLPVARVRLKNQMGAAYAYDSLKDLRIDSIKIVVAVSGIKNLALSNDFGVIDPSKPFQPFGTNPKLGASMILGNNELFGKKILSEVKLNITWKVAKATNVKISFLQAGKWGDDIAGTYTFANNLTFNLSAYKPILTFEKDEPISPLSNAGFVRFKLVTDLKFASYQNDIIDFIGKKLSPRTDDDINAPAFPVSPEVDTLSLNYKASQTLSMITGFQGRSGRFYHLHPFGYSEEHRLLNGNATPSLLPLFQKAKSNNDAELCLPKVKVQPGPFNSSLLKPLIVNDLDLSVATNVLSINLTQLVTSANTGQPLENEAEFYIGVTDLKPPQNISLLFQLAEGSANPKAIKPKEHVQWSYLSNNEWVAFKQDEVNDRTGQMIRSGITTLSVPRQATNANTLLPAGLHWLRASIARQADESGQPIATTSDAVCKIIKVAAQATRAVFADRSNAPDFMQSQLPAGTIAKLEAPQAEVKKMEQPFPTFGGRPVEAEKHFYNRVSERLRHKNRAITIWDYERLVLEAFPHIYKVKCLNHTKFMPTEQGIGSYNELAPGHVTCIAIPNLRNHNAIDPLRPYVSLSDLDSIGDFLKKHISCHVDLHVHNPVFEPVRVDFCVKFHAGVDEAFHLKLLKQDIVRFLSPWAFQQGKDISFGGRTFKSSLINFVEEQHYVGFVTDFKLFHAITDSEGNDRSKKDVEEIEASTAISILVSAAEEEHTVRAIPATVTDLAGERCNC